MTTGGQDPNQNPEDGKQFPPQDPYGQQGTPPPGSYPPPAGPPQGGSYPRPAATRRPHRATSLHPRRVEAIPLPAETTRLPVGTRLLPVVATSRLRPRMTTAQASAAPSFLWVRQLSYGWNKFKDNALVWIGISIIAFLIAGLIQGAFNGFDYTNTEFSALSIVGGLVTAIVGYIIQAAFLRGALSELDGIKPAFGTFFQFTEHRCSCSRRFPCRRRHLCRFGSVHHSRHHRGVPALLHADLHRGQESGCDFGHQIELRVDLVERRNVDPAGARSDRYQHHRRTAVRNRSSRDGARRADRQYLRIPRADRRPCSCLISSFASPKALRFHVKPQGLRCVLRNWTVANSHPSALWCLDDGRDSSGSARRIDPRNQICARQPGLLPDNRRALHRNAADLERGGDQGGRLLCGFRLLARSLADSAHHHRWWILLVPACLRPR